MLAGSGTAATPAAVYAHNPRSQELDAEMQDVVVNLAATSEAGPAECKLSLWSGTVSGQVDLGGM